MHFIKKLFQKSFLNYLLLFFFFPLFPLSSIFAQVRLDSEGKLILTPEEWREIGDDEQFKKFKSEKITPFLKGNDDPLKEALMKARLAARAWNLGRKQLLEKTDRPFPSLTQCHAGHTVDQVRAIRKQINDFFFPFLFNELAVDDYDILFLIMGAGPNHSHRRPKMVDEAVKLGQGKKVKVINLDPNLELELSLNHSEGVDFLIFPLALPGEDGSGFAPKIDPDLSAGLWKLIDGHAAKAKEKNKEVILLSTSYIYPLDKMIALWNKYKSEGHVHLILSYENVPTIVFNPRENFPSYETMKAFGKTHHASRPKVEEEKFKSIGQFYKNADEVLLRDLGIENMPK